VGPSDGGPQRHSPEGPKLRLSRYAGAFPGPNRNLGYVMSAALELSPLVAMIAISAFAGEFAWHYVRWRRQHRGDLPMTPFSLRRYWAFRAKGVGAAIVLALFAATIAVGLADSTLGGYLFFGVGVAVLVIFMTAYYTWRLRTIARWWGRGAEAESDPARNRKR